MGHCFGDTAVVAGRLAGAIAMLRTEHAVPVSPVTMRERMQVRLRDHLLTRFICVSEQTRQEHQRLLQRDMTKAMVVHNGIDAERFSSSVSGAGVHSEFGLEPETPIVGTVTRLSEERKGVSFFVEMAALVSAQRPDVRFLLVGDGSLQPSLERMAAQLGVADKLIFAGRRDNVPRLLAAMQVFVLPSLWEACQYSLLEAMAMAKPVACTAVGVAPEVVEDRVTGRLVPVANSQALSNAVLDLLSDEAAAERMARRGRDRVVPRFSREHMIDEVVEVYQSIAKT
jgi:glycosyltransferase involved in cell wall biosynthesis